MKFNKIKLVILIWIQPHSRHFPGSSVYHEHYHLHRDVSFKPLEHFHEDALKLKKDKVFSDTIFKLPFKICWLSLNRSKISGFFIYIPTDCIP